MSEFPEQRVNADYVSGFTGIPASTITKLAQQGRIPATKIGRRWTFSPSRIEQWIKEREEENLCRSTKEKEARKILKIATKGEKYGGVSSKYLGCNTERAYRQMMQRRQHVE